jgi:hypothetical protein
MVNNIPFAVGVVQKEAWGHRSSNVDGVCVTCKDGDAFLMTQAKAVANGALV